MSEQIATGSNDLHTGETIRTFKGHYINVFDPKPESIDIEDIAHALSHVCRFGGHTKEFYSVAQHSIEVMELCSDDNKLSALLHDASEAYMCDMPRPIKRHLPDYKKVENGLMHAIAQRFDLPWPFSPEIKQKDSLMLEWEHEHLILNRGNANVLTPKAAKKKFLDCFWMLRTKPTINKHI